MHSHARRSIYITINMYCLQTGTTMMDRHPILRVFLGIGSGSASTLTGRQRLLKALGRVARLDFKGDERKNQYSIQ